ncbi:LysR family transcriptional regulator, partial [Pantoea sp. CTOTU49201]|uniref:LysR family transcriptional regulator n=1 Tax=Pantoea sp. CTOTU49201 TaxID=2953855 RepID=UPI002897E215
MRFIYIATSIGSEKGQGKMAEKDTQELTNLMQIRAFSQVVAQGSVSRAADELFRTQSAITRAIRDLE